MRHQSIPRARHAVAAGICLLTTAATVLGAEPTHHLIGGVARASELPDHITGTVLLTELNCTACHASTRPALLPKGGPDLTEVAARVQQSYLADFIRDPSGTKPGTTMPDILGHLPEKERRQAASAMVQYLLTLTDRRPGPNPVDAASVERGREQYHQIGCAACHSPEKPIEGSVPLVALDRKYTATSLARFLKDPLAARPHGRMPDFQLTHAEAQDLSHYLLRKQDLPPASPPFRPALVPEGRRLFQKHQCTACHSVNGQLTPPAALPLERVTLSKGCLSDGDHDGPRYHLGKDQKTAIQAALSGGDLGREEQIQVDLTRFNCIACHDRNGFGGVTKERDDLFETNDPNVGAQGRVPPSLTGVGAKLTTNWLRKILVEGAPGRSYLRTRMPRFGAGNLDHLMRNLNEADQVPPVGPVAFQQANRARGEGRKLAGKDGFSCITCHTFKDRKTGVMGALDLAVMGQRINRDWFHHYMRAPQSFSPNTLMPAFWNEGQSAKPDILNGDTDQQIEALWLYLKQGYGAGQPHGLTRDPLRLVATKDEAVMLRRNYQHIGKRGIGVGYPRGVNIAYNAEQLCLAMIWQGDFADPAGGWTGQGSGTIRPLAREPIRFAKAPELVYLSRIDDPWPVFEGRPPLHRFKGYTLDQQQRPTFNYLYGNVRVNDYFHDVAIGESAKALLRRDIVFHLPEAPQKLVFRVAASKEITRETNHQFLMGNRLRLKCSETVAMIPQGDTIELRVLIARKPEPTTLTIDYIWTNE